MRSRWNTVPTHWTTYSCCAVPAWAKGAGADSEAKSTRIAELDGRLAFLKASGHGA